MMEKRYEHFMNDLITHKKHVMDSCLLMSEYLHKIGEENMAIEILRRSFIHDISKLDNDELSGFLELKIKEKSFTNANSLLNDYEKERIKTHWKKNKHHPEYFENIEEMEEIDIIEMVCDWFSRSIQFNTDIIEFAETRQKNRFKFPPEMFEKIIKYCFILKESYEKKYSIK